MSVVSRGALLVAAASLTTGLVAGPSAAYAADASTSLSAAEMSAALKAVGTASARAAAQGWKAGVTMAGAVSGSEWFAADPAAGVAYERFALGGVTMTQYVAAGKGTYATLVDPASRAAVKMMGRPAVRYVFTADKSVKLDADGMSPASLLTDDLDHPGTRTLHDDGSADYQLVQDGTTVTVHVDPAGVLGSAHADGGGMHIDMTYAYGPQHLTLPAGAATIGSGALAVGVAYLDMPASVREVVGEAATDALRAAHGHYVSVASLRKVARQDVTALDRAVRVAMVKATSVRGGVRIHATNPWTHRTVSYTLQPAGRKVTIARR